MEKINETIYAAMPWYRRQDYDKICSLMDDNPATVASRLQIQVRRGPPGPDDRDLLRACELRPTFDEWLAYAEAEEKSFLGRGCDLVIRAQLDPDDFVTWCEERGLTSFGEAARCNYALWFAYRRLVSVDFGR